VGGGWAGLAAAVTLAQAGIAATVFESAKTLGGRARRVEVHGLAIDNGQHILLGAYRETLALIRTVRGNLDKVSVRLPLTLDTPPGFLLRARPLPAPWHMAVGLATAKGLRLLDRFRAAGFLLSQRRNGFLLEHDIPLAQLLAQCGQTGALNEHLWYPLCLAALNTPPSLASSQVFLSVLRDAFTGERSDSDMLLPTVDLSQLFPEPAAHYIAHRGGRVLVGTRVTGLRRDVDGFTVKTARQCDSFSHVICAVPPRHLADLAGTIPEMAIAIDISRKFNYQPIYTIYLQYPDAIRLPRPMLGLTDGHGQWAFDRGQLGGAPGLLAVLISATGPHEALDHPGLARAVAGELARAFGLPRAPLWHQVIAEKRATFSCTPGLRRPSSRTPVPGLFLAGDYVAGDYPATIEGAVRSGVQCARHVLEM
jgi:squalene-associated FAD-dependent desaturase